MKNNVVLYSEGIPLMATDKIFLVVKDHKSSYPDPIILSKGEKVRLGKAYNGPENWPGWMFCHKLSATQSGWVPEQLITKNGKYGLIKEDYSAETQLCMLL